MKKLTQHEIARLLATRATPEPPAGLADRIKAEIPGSIKVNVAAPQPGRRWLMPPLIEGLHPSWLAAASVLLVAGVGFVAARIPSQPDDIWKWMALSGVVHIDDIVVTAPAPKESEGVAVAMAQPRASKGVRVAVQSRQKIAAVSSKAERADELGLVAKDAEKAHFAPEPETVALVATPPTGTLDMRLSGAKKAQGFEPAEAKLKVAGGATSEVGATMPRPKMAEELAVGGAAPAVSASAHAAAAGNRPSLAQVKAEIGERENALTVVILDEAGRPCEGVTVTLERLGQGATGTRTARTDAGGTATFRGVPPSTYRAVAAAPAIAPAQVIITVASERMPTRAELHVRALPRH